MVVGIQVSLCLEFACSSQTSEPSAKVTVQDGWSVSLWLSLEFGTGVQIKGTLDCGVSYPVKELDLLVGNVCAFVNSMGISTSTLSDTPT